MPSLMRVSIKTAGASFMAELLNQIDAMAPVSHECTRNSNTYSEDESLR
jgi:hypothetical protein